jgi:hypothetical protein
METMALPQALLFLKNKGYCLWIGAGVTTHISKAGGFPTPGWKELVETLEDAAQLQSPSFSCSFQERLEAVRNKLGRKVFQKKIRKLLTQLANGIIALGNVNKNKFKIPAEVIQIASLGVLANQIVNFNLETITSALLASPTGPYKIKSFEPPIVGASGLGSNKGSKSKDHYQRSIYHPHGTIDLHGLCILTKSDYKSMQGTLALQLAVHAAFQECLAIVGMSLEDEYLREQICQFRGQIKDIIWFTHSEPPEHMRKWLWENNVYVVLVSTWIEFWLQVEKTFPKPNRERLLLTWMNVISQSFNLRTENDQLLSFMFEDCEVPVEWQLLAENRGAGLNNKFELTPGEKIQKEEIIKGCLHEINLLQMEVQQ